MTDNSVKIRIKVRERWYLRTDPNRQRRKAHAYSWKTARISICGMGFRANPKRDAERELEVSPGFDPCGRCSILLDLAASREGED